jgi:hypothetical protein
MGWRIAARADFDAAGLAHVTALLDAAPSAVPWRMDVAAYLLSLDRAPNALKITDTSSLSSPWCPALSTKMRTRGRAAYEETLHPELLHDLLMGSPATER